LKIQKGEFEMRKLISKKRVVIFFLLLMFLLFQAQQVVFGEEKYPTRPIKFIVPISAGGPTDVIARKVGNLVGKSLGQEIIIENRVGAGGVVGATYLAKSKPDGYTIGSVLASTFILQPFFTKMDFDPLTDLTPIVQAYDIAFWLYVKDDSPIKSFKDFMEVARKRQLLVGCVGMLIGDIMLQRLGELAKLNLKLVPLAGGPQIDAALLGGQVDVGFSSIHAEYVRAGKMRLLLRLTEGSGTREFKDIPKVKDFGYDVNAAGFMGYFGPKGLPKHIHTKLEEEFARAVANPSVIEIIEKIGETPMFRNSSDYASYIGREHESARKVIKELGLGMFAKEKK
jgi:tripartite-type tricarboxylate transporter receptor subunit TctC